MMSTARRASASAGARRAGRSRRAGRRAPSTTPASISRARPVPPPPDAAVPTVMETSDPRASRFRSASSLSSTSSRSPTAWLGTVILRPRRAGPLCVRFGIGLRYATNNDSLCRPDPVRPRHLRADPRARPAADHHERSGSNARGASASIRAAGDPRRRADVVAAVGYRRFVDAFVAIPTRSSPPLSHPRPRPRPHPPRPPGAGTRAPPPPSRTPTTRRRRPPRRPLPR